MMPGKSKAQQKLMGAELQRTRAGKKTRTGISGADARDFAKTPHRGLPARKTRKR